jgi:hypothetical protein
VSVRLVLDTTALLAYVAADTRAVQVGELIATVEEGGDLTGVPALCLIAACNRVDAGQRTQLLELTADDDGPTVILPVLGVDVASVAELAGRLPYDLAQAASAAARFDALLGTYRRTAYGAAVHETQFLDL